MSVEAVWGRTGLGGVGQVEGAARTRGGETRTGLEEGVAGQGAGLGSVGGAQGRQKRLGVCECGQEGCFGKGMRGWSCVRLKVGLGGGIGGGIGGGRG